MKSTALIPAHLESFKAAIKHLKGTPATEANKTEGRAIIQDFASRLQLLDLTLDQQAARDILANAYRQI